MDKGNPLISIIFLFQAALIPLEHFHSFGKLSESLRKQKNIKKKLTANK